jgi:hypothetical protein
VIRIAIDVSIVSTLVPRAATLALLACSSSTPTARCDAGFLGKPGTMPELEILLLNPDNSIAQAQDGGTAPLILPPQGGRVIFAGARATGVDGCAASLTGSLRDEASSKVRVDMRTVDLIPTGDGWGTSAMSGMAVAPSNFANVPVCPNLWSQNDVFGKPYVLEVAILDREGRQASSSVEVTPQCAEPQNAGECLCICKAGYVLGQACMDAGPARDGAGE